MKILKNISIQSAHHSKPIVTDLFFEETNTPKPLVIFCHGYKGFKDWGPWNLVAEEFARNHCFFVKFNFSHNGGTLEQPIDYPDLDAFGKNNYCIELDDLETVIQWISQQKKYENELNFDSLHIIGHSRGGGIVTLKASENRKVKKVISWAGVSDFESRFPKGEVFEQWKKEKITYIINSRTQQQLPHYFQFYENFMANKERLTIRRAVSNLRIPYLIIHGTGDETVLIKEAEELHKWAKNSQLVLIPDASHIFDAPHSCSQKEIPASIEKVIKHTLAFIHKN